MSNFDLANLALKAVCPNNELIYDDKGLPSVMVKIPKMTYAQLGLGSSTAVHPAFIVNGVEKDAIYISKYQNVVQNGRAYSLPGQDPRADITFDAAFDACKAKGKGWHLMTRPEWALIALWCKANGTLPYGNNNFGKDARESIYKGVPSMGAFGTNCRIATGTGPLTWSHDRTPSGIWDLNGNVWEWVGNLRTVYGELQVLVNNNGADSSKDQSATSGEWKAISAADGSFITPNGSGTTSGSIKMSWSSGLVYDTTVANAGTHDCDFEAITCSANISDAAKLVLQGLGLLKYDATSGAYEGDHVWFNSAEAERSFYCGGHWSHGAGSGAFALYGDGARSYSFWHFGFRSAYVPL
ncbi:MAG: SUMF1/EgtB/PvdO family nonheme iron enzyme [Synergistaceae bacterium]|nr:SUMF1/EgtB/PvdO family nonheme iron enzyme [Synergistaceae bacterium]